MLKAMRRARFSIISSVRRHTVAALQKCGACLTGAGIRLPARLQAQRRPGWCGGKSQTERVHGDNPLRRRSFRTRTLEPVRE